MNKAVLIALLGVASIVSAFEIPMENYLKAVPAHVLMQNMMRNPKLESTATAVKWGKCSDEGVYDVAKGTNTPQPPQVGSNINLNLDVIFNDDANVSGLFIDVKLTAQGTSTPITLYSNDFKVDNAKVYHDGDELLQKETWLVPSFAPYGLYQISLKVHDPANQDTFVCQTAEFTISN